MNTSERMALQGLLLLVVEIQNHVRDADFAEVGEHKHEQLLRFQQVEHLVESDQTRDLIQLARTMIDKPVREECTCPANGIRSNCPAHGVERRAIPAAVAGVHT